MMFRTLLTSIDLFGIPVVFNFAGRDKFKSTFGGTCSLLIFGFVIFVVYTGFSELLATNNPNTVSSQTFSDDPRQLILSPSTFPLAFGIQAPQSLGFKPFINDSIFTMSMVHETIKIITYANGASERVSTTVPVTLEICKPEHFGDLVEEFEAYNLSKLHCISLNQPYLDEISLQGASISQIFESIILTVNECNNSTYNGACGTRAEIDAYLSSAWFNVIYTNMVINPSNYTHPDARFQDLYYTVLSPSSNMNTAIELSHVEVLTDSGWIGTSTDTKSYVKINRISDALDYRDPNNTATAYLSCSFQVSRLESRYTRSYKKLQTAIAEVAGLANTCLVVFFVLTSHYLKLKFNETLMNEIFQINTDPFKKKRKKNKRKQTEQTLPQNDDSEKDRDSDNEKTNKIATSKRSLKIEPPPAVVKSSKNSEQHKCLSASAYLVKKLQFDAPQDYNEEIDALVTSSRKNKTPRPLSAQLSDVKLKILKLKKKILTPTILSKDYSKLNQVADIGHINDPQDIKANHTNPSPASSKFKRAFSHQKKSELRLNKYSTKKMTKKVLDEPEDYNPEHSIMATEVPNNIAHRVTSEIPLQAESQKSLSTVKDCTEIRNSQDLNEMKHFEAIEICDDRSSSAEDADEKNEKVSIESSKPQQITLSVWEYISSFIYKSPRLKRKLEILEEGTKTINSKLDLVNILKKMREIDNVRAVLFDNDQLTLFNNLPKPELESISVSHSSLVQMAFANVILKRANLLQEDITEMQIMEAYQRIKSKQNKTEIDQKLLEILHDRLN